MIDPLDLGLGSAPAAPTLPTPTSANPSKSQKLMQLALLGLAGGLGPGAGTGILQGLSGSMQRQREASQKQDTYNRQIYEQQQQDYEFKARQYQAEQQARQRAVADAVQKLTTIAPTLKSRAEFDQQAETYASLLQSMGVRMSPNWLRSTVKYVSPDAKGVIFDALDALYKEPKNEASVDSGQWLDFHVRYKDPVTGEINDGLTVREAIQQVNYPAAVVGDKGIRLGDNELTPEQVAGKVGVFQEAYERLKASGAADDYAKKKARDEADAWEVKQARSLAQARDTTPGGGAAKVDKEWIIRNGRPLQIDKGTAQAGDRPYDKDAGGTAAPKLSAGQQDDLATMMTVEKLADDATTLGDQIGWSGVGGMRRGSVSAFAARNFGKGATGQESLRNKIGNIQATIAKLRGGTSFTPNEQALLESYTPTIDDSPQVIQTKLASLKDFIATKRSATVKVASGDFTPLSSHGAGGKKRVRYDLNGNVIGEE